LPCIFDCFLSFKKLDLGKIGVLLRMTKHANTRTGRSPSTAPGPILSLRALAPIWQRGDDANHSPLHPLWTQDWGYGGLCLKTNWFAFRAAHPPRCWRSEKPGGPERCRVCGLRRQVQQRLCLPAWAARARKPTRLSRRPRPRVAFLPPAAGVSASAKTAQPMHPFLPDRKTSDLLPGRAFLIQIDGSSDQQRLHHPPPPSATSAELITLSNDR